MPLIGESGAKFQITFTQERVRIIEQHCIYLCVNTINGKMYIGATNNFKRRMNEHKSHHKKECIREHDAEAKLFYEDVRKYGWNNFTNKIILTCDTFEEREQLEKKTIAEYKEKYGEEMIYNYCKGGRGGQTHDISGDKNPMYGKHWDNDKKEQIASKLRGRKDSDETRKKKSEAMKGKKKKPETVAKRSHKITIINIHTDEIREFPSKSEMKRNGIYTPTIIGGGITKDGWKLFEKSQETTENIDSEKDTIE